MTSTAFSVYSGGQEWVELLAERSWIHSGLVSSSESSASSFLTFSSTIQSQNGIYTSAGLCFNPNCGHSDHLNICLLFWLLYYVCIEQRVGTRVSRLVPPVSPWVVRNKRLRNIAVRFFYVFQCFSSVGRNVNKNSKFETVPSCSCHKLQEKSADKSWTKRSRNSGNRLHIWLNVLMSMYCKSQ